MRRTANQKDRLSNPVIGIVDEMMLLPLLATLIGVDSLCSSPICSTLVALLTTQSWWFNVLASFRCWGSPDDVAGFQSNFDVNTVAVPIYHTGDSLILSLPLLAKLIPSAQ